MGPHPDIFCFQFDSYGDSILKNMNILRQQKQFCDVVIYINEAEFHGHKVVLASGSLFLKTQFLLSKSVDIKISTVQSTEIAKQLLLSCYTGVLYVSKKELFSYLSVASYLEMDHVVKRCKQVLSMNLKDNSLARSHDPNRAQTFSRPQVLGRGFERAGKPAFKKDPENKDLCRIAVQELDIQIVKVEDEQCFPLETDGPGEQSYSQLSEPQQSGSILTAAGKDLGHSFQGSSGDMEVVSNVNFIVAAKEFEIQNLSLSQGSPHMAQDMGFHGPYQCTKCYRVFHRIENFVCHIKAHDLYVCLRCGRITTQRSNLSKHVKVHMGIKPFQCSICSKAFTNKRNWLDHFNVHSGARPHQCKYCHMNFAYKPALCRHVKDMHWKIISAKPYTTANKQITVE
ncbi:zinc finger and BTB domain-containing protein 26 [Microcaecilia unicolor]|uniref:Zinc finger and BTB domain-containing protein 26-like n=1 Tax=Microcaecilia unicolor TaxID=1415580 RepID=A0A6P7YJP3_9AMPH|nr:zinc finger and BTB domain-containing protein 26-like [Microcaecilia unicolor]